MHRLLFVFCCAGSLLQAATDSVTLRNRAGSALTDWPLQFGRVFVQGEIPRNPQALLNGQAVTTQANVETRWPDGSVKHAILSLVIPQLASGARATLTFQDQANCNCGATSRMSKAQMLDPGLGFDAAMEVSFGSGASTARHAREMLSAWDGNTGSNTSGPVSYWAEGAVSTTVIVADHSARRAFDFGADQNRSLRPIFHITFWPGIRKARVRFIVENASTEGLQDQTYSVLLKTGQAGTQVYSHVPFVHTAATRWTKTVWVNLEGSKTKALPTDQVDIDYNLPYLAESLVIPNYDPSKKVPEAVVKDEYAQWTAAPKDLYDRGNWYKKMGDAGGRPDIGPYPAWQIRWIYTGDYRMRQQVLGNCELADAWPMHLREENPAKYLDRGHKIPGVGRIMSISDRKTLSLGSRGSREVSDATNASPIRITSRKHGLHTGSTVHIIGVKGNAAANGDWSITVTDADHFTLDGSAGNGAYAGGGAGYLTGYDYPDTLSGDRVKTVGKISEGGWSNDREHLPNIWSLPYAMTGDFFYLEEGWFWVSMTTAEFNGSAYNTNYGRGPTGAEGSLGVCTIRCQAWLLNVRINIAWLSPDQTPEKALIEQWLADTVALREGMWNITNGPLAKTPVWVYGRENTSTNPEETLNGAYPPLFQFRRGGDFFAQANYGIDTSVASEAISQFEQHFMMYSLGRATELGYDFGRLRSRLARFYVLALTDPGYNPYLISNGRLPTVRKQDGKYFASMADLKRGYLPTCREPGSTKETTFPCQSSHSFSLNDPEHGYAFLALAATSMVKNEPGGATAWAFVESKILPAPVLDGNPKWAILPRPPRK
jgi:hypothetical protein